MPRSEKIKAAQAVVSEASTALTLDLVEELAEPLAEYMLGDYTAEDWQDSPLVETLARVAALLEVDGREGPGRYHESAQEGRRSGAADRGGL